MKKAILILIAGLLLSTNAYAGINSDKLKELKDIYEKGGISKAEYNAAQKIFSANEDKSKKKEINKKKSLTLVSTKKSKKKSLFASKKEVEPIQDEDLSKIEIYDKKKFQDEFLTFPPGLINFFGKNSNAVSRSRKAGSYMSKEFNRTPEGQQRFPGRMIKAMAMYEVFYVDVLRKNKKTLIRYKEKKNTKYFSKKDDEKKINSLISMNKGREKMRTALGMTLETSRTEAIKKFWFLGEFLDMGQATKNDKYDPSLKTRKNLLNEYKQKITKLKEKIQSEEEKESIN